MGTLTMMSFSYAFTFVVFAAVEVHGKPLGVFLPSPASVRPPTSSVGHSFDRTQSQMLGAQVGPAAVTAKNDAARGRATHLRGQRTLEVPRYCSTCAEAESDLMKIFGDDSPNTASVYREAEVLGLPRVASGGPSVTALLQCLEARTPQPLRFDSSALINEWRLEYTTDLSGLIRGEAVGGGENVVDLSVVRSIKGVGKHAYSVETEVNTLLPSGESDSVVVQSTIQDERSPTFTIRSSDGARTSALVVYLSPDILVLRRHRDSEGDPSDLMLNADRLWQSAPSDIEVWSKVRQPHSEALSSLRRATLWRFQLRSAVWLPENPYLASSERPERVNAQAPSRTFLLSALLAAVCSWWWWWWVLGRRKHDVVQSLTSGLELTGMEDAIVSTGNVRAPNELNLAVAFFSGERIENDVESAGRQVPAEVDGHAPSTGSWIAGKSTHADSRSQRTVMYEQMPFSRQGGAWNEHVLEAEQWLCLGTFMGDGCASVYEKGGRIRLLHHTHGPFTREDGHVIEKDGDTISFSLGGHQARIANDGVWVNGIVYPRAPQTMPSTELEEALSYARSLNKLPAQRDHALRKLLLTSPPTKEDRTASFLRDADASVTSGAAAQRSEYFVIPEEAILDASEAMSLAERMVAEAKLFWESKLGWKLEVPGDPANGVPRIESVAVAGPLAFTGTRLWRARFEIPSCAERTIHMLASPEGYQILDPLSDVEDFAKPVEQYPQWRPGGLLQVEHSFIEMPMLQQVVSFCVLNAICAEERFFISKSCLHPSLKGHSGYTSHFDRVGGPPQQVVSPEDDEGYRRALNTFALKVDPCPTSEERCVVTLANFADLCLPKADLPRFVDLSRFVDMSRSVNLWTMQHVCSGIAQKMQEVDAVGLEAPGALGQPFQGKDHNSRITGACKRTVHRLTTWTPADLFSN